jgi:hypothetical protein
MKTESIAGLLSHTFATDVRWHAEQQPDGTYRKRQGAASPALLDKALQNGGAIAIYQKNTDHSVRWICFDFDIRKPYLESKGYQDGAPNLINAVKTFCYGLADLSIPYLVEFSGNRGYHVWITFKENVPYRVAYEIQQALLSHIDPKYDSEIIAVDLFPSSPTATDGVGIGVKIPLSKHAKSNRYSYLLSSIRDIDRNLSVERLSETLLAEQCAVLTANSGTSRREIEIALDVFFDVGVDEQAAHVRVKHVKVLREFSVDTLMEHWLQVAPLALLAKKVSSREPLSHDTRKLLVGMLSNIVFGEKRFGQKILLEIFSRLPNYNSFTTSRAISRLSSFAFPSQEQIENVLAEKFSLSLTLDELLRIVVPMYDGYEDATFLPSKRDLDIVRAAELNYLFMNDEARSQVVIKNLSIREYEKPTSLSQWIALSWQSAKFYRHIRIEADKQRTLISLDADTRVFTSFVLKQIIYFLDLAPSDSSYGYRVNMGFKRGFIFQPWLYLWIQFLSNISSLLSDLDYGNFYIIKTDIAGFYDSIPHDNLKRLLLGGGNGRIDERLARLSDGNRETYSALIDAVFHITRSIVQSNVGLPQGPAYARYFAELYLDNLDQKFTLRLGSGEIVFYQRYVDDIFIICKSEAGAKSTLSEMTEDLKTLGLRVNESKTKIARVSNFVGDFDEYRSQAKYAVDHASHEFQDATDAQKNLAINEFVGLLTSENCDDDLSFVYSHLGGVPDLDAWKRENFEEIIKKRVGRGSLFKNMFNFALEDEANWGVLTNIVKYDELQSEALTAALIECVESEKQKRDDLAELVGLLAPKLTRTDLVQENLAFLILTNKISIDLREIPPRAYLACIRAIGDVDSLNVTSELSRYLNTALNDIKVLKEFVEVLYPLCASRSTSKTDLNELASVFYSKVSSDYDSSSLVCREPLFSCPASVAKFTYLVSLFCAAANNPSIELMKALWHCCIVSANSLEGSADVLTHKWYARIADITLDQEKALLLISAVVDGGIDRTVQDKKNVFEAFHNIFLLYMAFQDSPLYLERVQEGLQKLRKFGKFYEWLIDRSHVRLFPDVNRNWFEKNLADNGVVMLRRADKILVRRETSKFSSNTRPEREHNGYSEAVFDYRPEKYVALREFILDLDIPSRLNAFLRIVSSSQDELFPNIYCNEPILDKDTLQPFCDELKNLPYIIFEDFDGNVVAIDNNRNNFVKCFFNAFGSFDQFKMFKEKYLDNMWERSDLVEFVQNFIVQLQQIRESGSSPMFYDFAFASALHISLENLAYIRRIDRFVEIYHKFNTEDKDRHIYGVKAEMILDESKPDEMLKAVVFGLQLVLTESVPGLSFNLQEDVEAYRLQFNDLAQANPVASMPLAISSFELSQPQVLGDGKTIRFKNKQFDFSDVYIFVMAENALRPFTTLHRSKLSMSHVYVTESEGRLFILSVETSISKIFLSLRSRYIKYIKEANLQLSYPVATRTIDDIRRQPKFTQAANVVRIHRDWSLAQSEEVLINWLKYLPVTHHSMLLTLIAGHRVMTDSDIGRFLVKVSELMSNPDTNPFLIKRISDYNGTHRLLYRDNKIARTVQSLSPVNIAEDAAVATVIVDNVITGSQLIEALNFYATGSACREAANLFELTPDEVLRLKVVFSGLKELRICTVLYTDEGIKNVAASCRQFLNSDIKVSIVSGTDIGPDAFFGTTRLIGGEEKTQIRALLRDRSQMAMLTANLKRRKSAVKFKSDDVIDRTNMVARFQSLPKRCFAFLHHGLSIDENIYPLVRILESTE